MTDSELQLRVEQQMRINTLVREIARDDYKPEAMEAARDAVIEVGIPAARDAVQCIMEAMTGLYSRRGSAGLANILTHTMAALNLRIVPTDDDTERDA